MLESIKTQEKVDFVKNISLLVKSGKPINDSLSLLAEQARNPKLKRTLTDAKNKVETGTSLYKAFEEDKNFGKIFTSFIKAGEESGTLEKNLKHLADWLEKSNNLKKKISSATLYPKIVIVFALVLGMGLTVFILPQMESIFAGLDVEMHASTRFLMWVSETVQNHGHLVFGSIFLFIFSIWMLLKLRPVRRIWDKIKLKLPVVGSITKEYQLTIISQLIATLFGSGLTITDTLDIIAGSVTNTQYEESIRNVRKTIITGGSLREAIEGRPDLYPSIFISLVATGEQTGSFGESFSYLAKFYSERVSQRVERLPNILEPILLIGIGVMVAFIAASVILPVYQVTEGLY